MKFWLLIFTSLLRFYAYAQDEKIRWDHPLQENYKKTNSVLLGMDVLAKAFYFLKQEDQKYYIQKFNSDNQKVYDKEVNFSGVEGIQNNSFSIGQSIMLKDRFVLLLLAPSEKRSEVKLFLQDISLDAEIIGGKKPFLQENSNTRCSYHLSLSPDSSKIVLCLAIPKQKRVDKNQIDVKIYNDKLEELTSRKIYFSVEENANFKRIQVKNVLLNNKGDLYILGSKFTRGVSNDCSLWYLAKDADYLDPISIGSINLKLKEYKLQANSYGEPILIGLYTESVTKTHFYGGYFYGKINESSLSINLKTDLIPSEIQHPPYSTDGYYPELEILNKKDGGQILILEYIWVKSNNPHFGDLLVLNLDSNGSLMYSTFINKNQSKYLGAFRAGDYFNYYSYLPVLNESKNTLSVFFNDNPKNSLVTNEEANSLLLNINNNILASVEIDSKGNLSKKIVISPSNNDIVFCTGLRVKFVVGESVVIGLKNDEVWLGKLLTN